MKNFKAGGKDFLKFTNLTRAGIFHFISTRKGWGHDMKTRFTGNQPGIYQQYRKELANALQVNPQNFVFPRQIHSDHIALIDNPVDFNEIQETDAIITNQPGMCICVQTADCVPLLLYDPHHRVVAAVHAGWRGTVNKIIAKTIHQMQLHFDSEPDELVTGIGPSIHLHAYEVGPDVISAVRDAFPDHRELLKPSLNGEKAFFDLWNANKVLMIESGMKEEHIEIMGMCSYSHEELFYSYRRDGADTGRMVSGIMLRELIK